MASQRTAFVGNAVPTALRPARTNTRAAVAVRAQLTRREGLIGFVAGVGALVAADASEAAYGEGANILGKTTDTSGFIPYAGEGFGIKIPSKWNPSPERDFDGVVIRYEDNFDPVSNFIIISRSSDKRSVTDYGSPSDFLGSTVQPLLGQQVFSGETISEGGFKPNLVSAAALLDAGEVKDKNGKSYYRYEILARSADGDEGGRHQLVSASVSNGKLIILKAQCGDKRWFKGAEKNVRELINSFVVA